MGYRGALDLGADVVICPRVTDASLVIGPAAWKFGWKRDDLDKLSGALAAGHIIECGAQPRENYAFFEEVKTFKDIGYPIAESMKIIHDHKHENIMIDIHWYSHCSVAIRNIFSRLVNPDVIGHFDSLIGRSR